MKTNLKFRIKGGILNAPGRKTPTMGQIPYCNTLPEATARSYSCKIVNYKCPECSYETKNIKMIKKHKEVIHKDGIVFKKNAVEACMKALESVFKSSSSCSNIPKFNSSNKHDNADKRNFTFNEIAKEQGTFYMEAPPPLEVTILEERVDVIEISDDEVKPDIKSIDVDVFDKKDDFFDVGSLFGNTKHEDSQQVNNLSMPKYEIMQPVVQLEQLEEQTFGRSAIINKDIECLNNKMQLSMISSQECLDWKLSTHMDEDMFQANFNLYDVKIEEEDLKPIIEDRKMETIKIEGKLSEEGVVPSLVCVPKFNILPLINKKLNTQPMLQLRRLEEEILDQMTLSIQEQESHPHKQIQSVEWSEKPAENVPSLKRKLKQGNRLKRKKKCVVKPNNSPESVPKPTTKMECSKQENPSSKRIESKKLTENQGKTLKIERKCLEKPDSSPTSITNPTVVSTTGNSALVTESRSKPKECKSPRQHFSTKLNLFESFYVSKMKDNSFLEDSNRMYEDYCENLNREAGPTQVKLRREVKRLTTTAVLSKSVQVEKDAKEIEEGTPPGHDVSNMHQCLNSSVPRRKHRPKPEMMTLPFKIGEKFVKQPVIGEVIGLLGYKKVQEMCPGGFVTKLKAVELVRITDTGKPLEAQIQAVEELVHNKEQNCLVSAADHQEQNEQMKKPDMMNDGQRPTALTKVILTPTVEEEILLPLEVQGEINANPGLNNLKAKSETSIQTCADRSKAGCLQIPAENSKNKLQRTEETSIVLSSCCKPEEPKYSIIPVEKSCKVAKTETPPAYNETAKTQNVKVLARFALLRRIPKPNLTGSGAIKQGQVTDLKTARKVIKKVGPAIGNISISKEAKQESCSDKKWQCKINETAHFYRDHTYAALLYDVCASNNLHIVTTQPTIQDITPSVKPTPTHSTSETISEKMERKGILKKLLFASSSCSTVTIKDIGEPPPLVPIYSKIFRCNKCNYTTKVRSEFVHHQTEHLYPTT